MSKKKSIVCFVLMVSVVPTGFADDAGLYVGAGIGRAEHARNAALKPPGIPLMTGATDARDTSWTATLGYRINSNIAFEFGYMDLGDMEASVADPSGESDARAGFNFSVDGVTVAMLGRFPVGNWTPYIRAGVLFSQTELTYAGASSGVAFEGRVKDQSEGAFFGAGMTYNFGSQWAAQLDFTHVMNAADPQHGQSDYHAPSIGLLWRF